ncbi:MAG: hypothetical protein K9G60_01140 [Pseudolabrys sp.]|nr:hypothetical protein [Pseudolabrys sp.]
MHGQNRKKIRETEAGGLIQGLRREEIEGDVFELWIGISRLMARVRETPQFECRAARAANARVPNGKMPAAKRSPAIRPDHTGWPRRTRT